MVLTRSRLDHSAGYCSDVLQWHNDERLRWHNDERLRWHNSERTALSKSAPWEMTALSAIANRFRLESFSGERGGLLWDTIEEGLGTYLYGLQEMG
jgi:hypothetical protein